MKKKLIVILLSLAVLFTFMPVTAYAGTPCTWDSTHSYYYGTDGNPMRGWFYDEDACYYGDPATGAVKTGWQKLGGYWYYFAVGTTGAGGWYDNGQMYDNGPMSVKGNYYFFAPSDKASKWGKLQYGWCELDGCWYYADAAKDGVLAAGWKKIDGKWYYFEEDRSCEMIANMTYEIGGKLYAFDRSGALHDREGWADLYELYEDGTKESWWVYTDRNGVAATGWKKIGGAWYYFGDYGYMWADDWAEDSAGWMWLGSNGKPVRNKWIKDSGNGEWYYLKSDGYMAANEWARDGIGWMYMGSNGKAVRDKWIKSGGCWYYLKDNGYMAANEWAYDSVGRLRLDGSGRIIKGKMIDVGGASYFVDKNGYLVTNKTVTIDGFKYWADESGVLNPL